MEILYDILSFAAKGLIVFLTIFAITVVIVSATRRGKSTAGKLTIKRLNHKLRRRAEVLRHATMDAASYKKRAKELIKEHKKRKPLHKNVFILDFHGDVMASGVASLREEITALVEVCGPDDEVVVKLESPGGVVANYGLAASQLQRLKDRNIRLVVCVDRVAASGGYMMACVADEIIAAPFAMIGSIGVVAPVPNLHRLLEKHGVEYEEMTAGEFKRTVSIFGKITEKGRQKFQDQIEETHTIFKDFVRQHRPAIDIDAVATGEYWLGSKAQELGLVNRLSTSDAYLAAKIDEANLLEISYKPPRNWRERLSSTGVSLAEALVMRLLTRLMALRFNA